MATQTSDVISVLTEDHREVEELFGELESVSPGELEELSRLTTDITIELVRHSVAEEMYLYPATRQYVPGGDEIADREIEDHAEVEKILKRLEKSDPGSEDFSGLLSRLMGDVREHVEDEENNLFPRLAEHVSEEKLVSLGKKIQAAKKTAPTRPHPSAPSTPPLNKLLAPGAGLVDRARDYLTGRGQE